MLKRRTILYCYAIYIRLRASINLTIATIEESETPPLECRGRITPSCLEQAEMTSKRNRVIGRINVSSRGHTANLRTHLKTKGNDCAEHKILWEKYETRFNEELGKGTNLCPLEKKKYKDSKSLTLTRADCIANVIQLCVVNNLPYSFFQQNYNRYDV